MQVPQGEVRMPTQLKYTRSLRSELCSTNDPTAIPRSSGPNVNNINPSSARLRLILFFYKKILQKCLFFLINKLFISK